MRYAKPLSLKSHMFLMNFKTIRESGIRMSDRWILAWSGLVHLIRSLEFVVKALEALVHSSHDFTQFWAFSRQFYPDNFLSLRMDGNSGLAVRSRRYSNEMPSFRRESMIERPQDPCQYMHPLVVQDPFLKSYLLALSLTWSSEPRRNYPKASSHALRHALWTICGPTGLYRPVLRDLGLFFLKRCPPDPREYVGQRISWTI
ncbi:hypothetical protein C8J56DRAFT_392091 [Mycena floridula]|nr:hypothetical protein C8J56DRAFT_392091 [Mycena floridula]